MPKRKHDLRPVHETLRFGFNVGRVAPLTENDVNTLVSQTGMVSGSGKRASTMPRMDAVLCGRAAPETVDLPGTGRVVVKQYYRGGLLGKVVRDRYLRLGGKSRARKEFDMLALARSNTISVPEPLGYIEQGNAWYRCWLVTREIPGAVTLASLAQTDQNRAESVMPQVMEQVALLIRHGLMHVDFHPGNVLIRPDNSAWLIDFDKAFLWRKGHSKMFDRYKKRWTRAVHKHGLPHMLHQRFTGTN